MRQTVNMPNNRCDCEWLGEHEACLEPIYAELNGRKYCVLHYPEPSKTEDFLEALKPRFDESNENYLNFVGIWFPGNYFFDNYKFTSAADFTRARFSDSASFRHVEFYKVDFSEAEFNGYVNFSNARFSEVNFSEAKFAYYVNFSGATFLQTGKFSRAQFDEPASFALATFEGKGIFLETKFSEEADFRGVEFKNDVSFEGARFESFANFGAARIDSDRSNARGYPIQQQRTRFRNADFTAATFTTCSFKMACFQKLAQFSQTVVRDAVDFSIADFNESSFSESRLAGSNFDGAFFLKTPNFNKTEFMHMTIFSTARFPGVDFSDSVFSGNVDFTLSRFESSVSKYEEECLQECFETADTDVTSKSETIRIAFDRAIFKDGLTVRTTDFFQDRCLLTFDDAIFEKPERVKFQSVSMPPHSFINIDPRKFHFADVRWGFIDKRTALREAKAALEKHQRLYSDPMLELAYRQLAVNAEENNRYEEAANLRYLAMEVARSMRWRKVDWLRLSWWYWLLSGYGERVRRAFTALLVIWLGFALVYWSWSDNTWWQPRQQKQTSSEKSETLVEPQLTFSEALLYSGSVMALQKPEPFPANKRAKLLVLGETILGPLQAALLALAIRRKFMR